MFCHDLLNSNRLLLFLNTHLFYIKYFKDISREFDEFVLLPLN